MIFIVMTVQVNLLDLACGCTESNSLLRITDFQTCLMWFFFFFIVLFSVIQMWLNHITIHWEFIPVFRACVCVCAFMSHLTAWLGCRSCPAVECVVTVNTTCSAAARRLLGCEAWHGNMIAWIRHHLKGVSVSALRFCGGVLGLYIELV